MNNYDGEYYAFDPKIGIEGNFGINIFPKTKKRTKFGYIITERFLLNAIYKLKKEMNIGNLEPIENATWNDVNKVINYCISEIQSYNNVKNYEKSLYIKNEVVDFINVYIDALKEANYPAKVFFDPNFTIDTGIICNLGRAISEFKGLTSKFNEPLTPTHERNYGKYNSKMTKEGIAWRLSCGYKNKIIIEELSLKDTARKRGQVQKEETIFLKNKNEKLNFDDLSIKQLIPGQVNIDTLYFYKEFGENGYLASYSDYGFNYDGIYWKTLEHYYQAQKFSDINIKIKIANCNSPKEASNIGRSREYPIINDWDKKRIGIMKKGLLLKFTNNAIIKNKLLLTGDKIIIEATTKELFWGCGLSGFGENNYGKLLMEVRSIIKKENL